jgi:hypothetical protein
MSNVARVAGQAANTLVKPLEVEEVFSTYLYTGNSGTQTITNGIDLSGEGGLTWIKNRSSSSTNHSIFDSESGATGGTRLRTNLSNGLQAFNGTAVFTTSSTGFALNNDASNDLNDSSYNYVSWTFRKAPKFFDVVTYTGDGTTNDGSSRLISHNLGSTPGFYIVKRTDAANNWRCFHRSLGATKAIQLNGTGSAITSSGWWADVAPTDTNFSVTFNFNETNANYVVYLFAHNDSGDGEFGPNGNADIVKCGSYTGNGSTNGPEIDLGFEPQWVMIKRTDSTADWVMQDVMRGMIMDSGGAYIKANDSAAEFSTTGYIQPEPSGFKVRGTGSSQANASGGTYIYIAIRRPTAVPESATELFAISDRKNEIPSFPSGFPVDFLIGPRTISGADNNEVKTRLISGGYLRTNTTAAENASSQVANFAHNDGFFNSSGANASQYSWMWKRAPNYMDVVAFTGTGSAGTHNHNLTVPPEMMWVKSRAGNGNWFVYHAGLGATKGIYLNENGTGAASPFFWNNTAPTSSVFSVGASLNQASASIAYLFATLAGISKVGSVTQSGTTNVDCGFTSGARFVLLKRTDASGDWYLWDSTRGIVSGNDPYLLLNSTAAQVAVQDYINPLPSGFTITSNFDFGDYIFYAIA